VVESESAARGRKSATVTDRRLGFGFGERSEIAGEVEFGAVGHGVVRVAISGSISHGGGL
jgi:hypothetical protein